MRSCHIKGDYETYLFFAVRIIAV